MENVLSLVIAVFTGYFFITMSSDTVANFTSAIGSAGLS